MAKLWWEFLFFLTDDDAYLMQIPEYREMIEDEAEQDYEEIR